MKSFFVNIKKSVFLKGEGEGSGKKFARSFAEKSKRGIESMMKKMGSEARETKEMARSFYKLLDNKLDLQNRTVPPSEEEVLEAIEQLRDVGRLSVFITAVILPGGVISLAGLELLARKYGIKFTFIPSSFRKNAEWKQPHGAGRRKKSFQKIRKGDISDVKPLKED